MKAPNNCLQLSLGSACNPGRGAVYSEGQHHEFWILSPLESWILCPSPTCLPDPGATGLSHRQPCSWLTSSPRTSTRAWTSDREGPPAPDTSTPPPTAARACPPPFPAHLTTTTALVRRGEAPKRDKKSQGAAQQPALSPAVETAQGFPLGISITAQPSGPPG